MKRKLTKIQIEKRGFTLVELLVVITVITILAGISVVTYTQVQKNARDGKRKADLTSIQNNLELYYSSYNQYPGETSVCESSRGSCDSCPCSGNDWTGTTIATALVSAYVKDLPADPKNDDTYYYEYEPVCNETSTICGINNINCTGTCCEYELSARLENGTTFRVCSP